MGKRFLFLPVMFFSLLVVNLTAEANSYRDVDVWGPYSLAARSKPYSLSLAVDNPKDQYYIELKQEDGVDISFPDCRKKRFIRKVFCFFSSRWNYWINHRTRINNVEVLLNGKKIVHKKEFNWSTGVLQKQLLVSHNNKIKIKVRGRFASSVQVRVFKQVADLPPVAKFNYQFDSGESNLIRFDASESYDDVKISSYSWDFGDGLTADGISPSHQYEAPGNYQVTLNVTDSRGQISNTSQLVQILGPVAQFDWYVETDVLPYLVTVFSFSYAGDSPIVKLTMDYGDGIIEEIDTKVVVRHSYTLPGIYVAKLTVEDADGRVDTQQAVIDLQSVSLPVPIISGGLLSGPLPLKVDLDAANSYSANGEIITYRWSLSLDCSWNQVSKKSTLSLTINDPGIYCGVLSLEDSAHRISFYTFQINAGNLPTVNWDWVVNSTNSETIVDFFNFSNPNGDGIISYQLDYGDGTIETFGNDFSFAQHSYPSAGLYNAKLTAYTSGGVSNSMSHEVDIQNVVFPQINVTGGPLEGFAPLKVNFDASGSTSVNGSILYFGWDFTDDGLYNPTSDQATGSYEFLFPGTYRIHVRAQDVAHRNAHYFFDVIVKSAPSDYNMSIIASQDSPSNSQINLQGLLTPKNDSVLWPLSGVTYDWYFGDGQLGAGEIVAHNYSDNGPYRVTLIAHIPNQNDVYASLTLNNLNKNQYIDDPTFLLIGNNGPAPMNLFLDATGYASSNPNIVKYEWSSTSNSMQVKGKKAFINYPEEGVFDVRLTVTNQDGFSKVSTPRSINVVGRKAPIYAYVEINGPTDSVNSIGSLDLKEKTIPAFVGFDASQSHSNVDENLQFIWSINGQTLLGSKVYYNFTKTGTYTIQLMVKDESGRTTTIEKNIIISNLNCFQGAGDNLCPVFRDYPNKILPYSMNSWVLKTGASENLLSKTEQIAEDQNWLSVYDSVSLRTYIFSDRASVSGTNVILNKADFEYFKNNSNFDLLQEHELQIQAKGETELFYGAISGFKFGFGSANIEIEGGSFVQVLSAENRFYKQFDASNGGAIHLKDLGSGTYTVIVNKNGNTRSEAFDIVDSNTVTINLVNTQSLTLSATSTVSSLSPTKKIGVLTPQEASDFEGQKLKEFYQASQASQRQSNSFSNKLSQVQPLSVAALASPEYPSWLKVSCSDDKPTQFPLAAGKYDEFKVEGIKGWQIGAYKTTHENFGDFLNFNKLSSDAIVYKSGKRAVRVMCTISGHLHNAAAAWWFNKQRNCCTNQTCRDSWSKYYKSDVVDFRRMDGTPIHFKFSVKDTSKGTVTDTTSSYSYYDAARTMGLNSTEDIQSYFGIVGDDGKIQGLGYPAFTEYILIPEDIIDPELKIEINPYEPIYTRGLVDYRFGCYIANSVGYTPSITGISKLQKYSSEPSSYTEIQKDNSDRLFGNYGKFPLNWGANDFADSRGNDFKFDPKFPIEFYVENGLGIKADRIKINIEHNGDDYEKVIEGADVQLVERKYIDSVASDVYRIALDPNEYQDDFLWNLNKTFAKGLVRFQIEWDLNDGSVKKSSEKPEEFAMSYNLSLASDKLCSKGFYSNYNPFATAAFLQKYAKIDSDLLGGRCNDIGHPFGGAFFKSFGSVRLGHKGLGHMLGVGIDVRYPNSEKEGGVGPYGTPVDLYDQSGRGAQIEKMKNWADNLVNAYSDPEKHDTLKAMCNIQKYSSCSSLEFEGGGASIRSIQRFCHVASTESEINDDEMIEHCVGFPREDAIALSKNIEEIRRSIDAVTSIFPESKVYVGNSWFEKMIISSEYESDKNSNSFFELNTDDKFTGNFLRVWKNKRVKSKPGHQSHLHISLF